MGKRGVQFPLALTCALHSCGHRHGASHAPSLSLSWCRRYCLSAHLDLTPPQMRFPHPVSWRIHRWIGGAPVPLDPHKQWSSNPPFLMRKVEEEGHEGEKKNKMSPPLDLWLAPPLILCNQFRWFPSIPVAEFGRVRSRGGIQVTQKFYVGLLGFF